MIVTTEGGELAVCPGRADIQAHRLYLEHGYFAPITEENRQ